MTSSFLGVRLRIAPVQLIPCQVHSEGIEPGWFQGEAFFIWRKHQTVIAETADAGIGERHITLALQINRIGAVIIQRQRTKTPIGQTGITAYGLRQDAASLQHRQRSRQ